MRSCYQARLAALERAVSALGSIPGLPPQIGSEAAPLPKLADLTPEAAMAGARHTALTGGRRLAPLYIVGIPGSLGGASTKIVHLLHLLRADFSITVVAPEIWVCKDRRIREMVESRGGSCVLLKELPKKLDGVAVGFEPGKQSRRCGAGRSEGGEIAHHAPPRANK